MANVDAQGSTDPLVGQVLGGRFRIVRLIDRGGMGRVYEAVQEPLGRTCAVKTLDLADPSGEFEQRFFNEARLCAKLTHPHTVRIFDYGHTDDGVYYFAMELLEGRTLRNAIKEDGAFSPDRALHVIRQLCGAIGEAHAAGIVHRDLKPANVFLCPHDDDRDFVKVLDFGLVKELSVDAGLSSRDVVLGSPMYMAPEQIEARDVDQRCDVYAIGLILWTALTARVPFKAPSRTALLAQQVLKDPPPLAKVLGPDHDVPASLEQLVRYAVAKEPEKRLGSVADLAKGLAIVKRELDGRLGPVTFDLQGGCLIVPPGVETGEVATLPRAPAVLQPEALPSGETLRTNLTIPTAPVAALGAGVVLMGGAGAVVAALLLLAGLVYLWTPERAPAPVPAPAPVVVTPEPTPAPTPTPTAIEITSDPVEADVFRDGALIGSTPIELQLPPGDVWTLEIAMPGHIARDVTIDGTATHLNVRLDKAHRARPREAPQPVEAPAPAPAPRGGLGGEVRSPWDD